MMCWHRRARAVEESAQLVVFCSALTPTLSYKTIVIEPTTTAREVPSLPISLFFISFLLMACASSGLRAC